MDVYLKMYLIIIKNYIINIIIYKVIKMIKEERKFTSYSNKANH